jgi:hypothetical protein
MVLGGGTYFIHGGQVAHLTNYLVLDRHAWDHDGLGIMIEGGFVTLAGLFLLVLVELRRLRQQLLQNEAGR